MKHILVAVFLLIISAAQAQAAWTDDFLRDYDAFGIDRAVENALGNDITPNDILKFVISQRDEFKTKITMKALYCAGVDQNVVHEAAKQLGITDENISVALEESIEECGSKLSLSDRDILDVPESGGGEGEKPPAGNKGAGAAEAKGGRDDNREEKRPRPKPASPSSPSQLN